MHVNPKDGRCRECGGTLEIVDASEDTLSVECSKCGEFYDVETDAFHDGAMHYYPAFLAQKLSGGEDHDA